jgi:hypothetical protein
MIGTFFKRLATVVVGLLAFTAVTTADVPTLLPGDSWEHTYTCSGFSYSGLINPAFGGPLPTGSAFTISTDINSKQWWIGFGGGYQYANASGAWTLQSGTWFAIPGVNYMNQALYQHYTQDVSQDPCVIKNFGLIYDITSCGCQLASEVLLYNDTDPHCRGNAHSQINNDPRNQRGVYFLEWRFSQLFSVIQAGGTFAGGSPQSWHHKTNTCSLSFTPPPFGTIDPAVVLPVPFCAIFNPPTCSPPRPVA